MEIPATMLNQPFQWNAGAAAVLLSALMTLFLLLSFSFPRLAGQPTSRRLSRIALIPANTTR